MVYASTDLLYPYGKLRLVRGVGPRHPLITLAKEWEALTGANYRGEHLHSATGRPYIPGLPFDISLSHTYRHEHDETAFLLGATETPKRIGVDIENQDRKLVSSLVKKLLEISPKGDPITTWTLLEAFAKCVDQPLALNKAELIPGEREGNVQEWHYSRDPLVRGWTVTQDDYRISVALSSM